MKIKKLDVPFAQVANQVLNDSKLSFKAKGIFAYIQGKPDDWDFAAERMARESIDGERAILSGQKELIENGYLIRKKNADGTLSMALQLPEPERQNSVVGQEAKTPFQQDAEIADSRNSVHNKEISSTKKDEEKEGVCAENLLFKEFWDQYPKRKRDREKCLTSFEKLPLKVQELIVSDVKERKAKHWDWVKENHQFVPAPLVYIRNKRWEEKIDGQGKVSNVFHNQKVEKPKVNLEKIAV